MRKVGIKTLKNKLSEYIRAAAAGETILVTDRGRVVAQVSPQAGAAASDADARWNEHIRTGLVTPAADRKAPLPSVKAVMTFDELMKELDAGREDRI